jgi:uncharacterized protein (DUF1778 family)
MPSSSSARSARVEARLAPEALALVKRAAEIEGRSVSDFMVSAAQDAARRTIEDSSVIRLAAEDQLKFVEMLLNPPEPNEAWKRAAEAHRRLIVKS